MDYLLVFYLHFLCGKLILFDQVLLAVFTPWIQLIKPSNGVSMPSQKSAANEKR